MRRKGSSIVLLTTWLRFDSPNAVAHLKRREAARLSARHPVRHSTRLSGSPQGDDHVVETDDLPSLPKLLATPRPNLQDLPTAPSNHNRHNVAQHQQSDDWHPANEDDQSDNNQDLDHLRPPASSADVVRSVYRQRREQEKENLNDEVHGRVPSKSRFFNERQDNAERVEWDEGQSAVLSPVRDKQKSKKLRVSNQSDEDDSEGFQVDERASEGVRDVAPRRVTNRSLRTTQAPPRTANKPREDSRGHRDQIATGRATGLDLTVTAENDSARVDDMLQYPQINQVAKSVVRSRAPHKVQVRRAWGTDETLRLIELIEDDRYGTSWVKIENCHDPLLQGRGQGALKDKARNIKVDFLKYVQSLRYLLV